MDRRGFLTSVSAAAGGLALGERFASVRNEVQRAADRARSEGGAAPRSEWSLAEGLAYLNHASIGTVPPGLAAPPVVSPTRIARSRVCRL